MTLVITDLSVINYASVQLLKNTRLRLISKSGKFHTHLKNGNRKRINGTNLVAMNTIGKSMDIFLSFFDNFHQTWGEILVIGNDRHYWFFHIIVKTLPTMFHCPTLKWLYFDVKYCYSKFFTILYTSQFKISSLAISQLR